MIYMTRLRAVIWQIFRRAGYVRFGPAVPILNGHLNSRGLERRSDPAFP